MSSMKPFGLVPLVPRLEVERRQAADRGALVAEMILTGRQRISLHRFEVETLRPSSR